MDINSNNTMEDIKISCFNANGFSSSQPYISHLLSENHVLGVSEHWLSGPEIPRLSGLSVTHEVTGKSHRNLEYAPPDRGRGYGGVALYWHKDIVAAPFPGIKSDRIIGIQFVTNGTTVVVLNVYMPNVLNDEFIETVDELAQIVGAKSNSASIMLMGDFNVSLGALGGARGAGQCTLAGQLMLDALCNDELTMVCADMGNKGCGPTYTFQRQGIGCSWIDHVFISADMYDKVRKCEVMNEHALNMSDHLPICLSLTQTIPCNVDKSVDKCNTKLRVKWHKMSQEEIAEKYTNVCDENFQELCDTIDENNAIDIDVLVDNVTSSLLNISRYNLLVCKSKKSRAKPFWCEELSDKLADRNVAYKESSKFPP